ncbi:hypothetical protein Tco_0754335 [Tanacetum coccineum]
MGEMGVHKAGVCHWECREERECIEGPRLQCHHGSLIDIAQTPLENSYDVELADGKIVGISAKKEEDKSEGKQLKDVPIVQDFPEVFPEDFLGLPLARPVEF